MIERCSLINSCQINWVLDAEFWMIPQHGPDRVGIFLSCNRFLSYRRSEPGQSGSHLFLRMHFENDTPTLYTKKKTMSFGVAYFENAIDSVTLALFPSYLFYFFSFYSFFARRVER